MKPLLLSFLLLFCLLAQAQTTVSGTIKNNHNKPLAGASITLKDTYDGATSDSAGNFVFTTTEQGIKVLEATAMGYKAASQTIDLAAPPENIALSLKEAITEMKAVVISAGAFEAGDRKKGTVLSSLDILTTASANADVTGAIKTLPGAQQVGESEGLFVRGGTAAETKTFMDGTLVNNFFFSSVPNVAQRGRFSPWFLKGTVFSMGGYSALYGQALSSALVLETVDLPDQSSANLGVSFLSLSGGFQQLAKNKKSSWGATYAYTDLSVAFNLIKQRQQFFQIPVYHTGDFNFRVKTSPTGMLKYYGYLSTNKLGFTEPSIDSLGYRDGFRLSNENTYHNLSYKEVLAKGWRLNAGVSYTYNHDDISGALYDEQQKSVLLDGLQFKQFGLDSRSHYANGKIVLEKKIRNLSALRFGSEYNYSSEETRFQLYDSTEPGGTLEQATTAAFAEGDVYLTNNLAAKLGTRFEYASLLARTNIAPRLSLAYKLGTGSQASVAYGVFYQNPESRYLPASAPLLFSKATHYIAQYQKMTGDRTLRAELFYKQYDDLVKTGFAANREVAINNEGYGDAKGFDLFWRDRKSLKGVDYWVSYSYLDTKRNFLNYPTALKPPFAANHTASVVLKRFVPKFKTQVNGSYTYASGRPYYNFQLDDNTNKFKLADRGRTIDYNSMSISLNYLPNVFKSGAGKYSVFVFSVTNVLNSRQVFGYKYSVAGNRKEAITPPARMFFFLGAFLSFGVDRSQDVINSNL
jgi:vitamin B12 transporter